MERFLSPRRTHLSDIECLEGRKLFSIAVNNGVLEVTGTTSAETMYASWNSNGSASTVKVSDGIGSPVTYTIATAPFSSIYFYGGNGNDIIQARRIQSGFNHYTALLPVTINGGAGADSLTGSDAADSINGGSSNDTIIGYGGNDSLKGDAGDDDMDGGDGADTLEGGDGVDILYSGSFDSNPFGTQGDGDVDFLYGNARNAGSDGDDDGYAYETAIDHISES